MTQPTTPTARGGFGSGLARPLAVKPKLSDEELRLECMKLAVQSGVNAALLVETAKKLHDFVKSGIA